MTTTTHPSTTRAWRTTRAAWTKIITDEGSWPCRSCGQPIHPDQPWHLGHHQAHALGGNADPDNLAPEHEHCNTSAGGQLGARLRFLTRDGLGSPQTPAVSLPRAPRPAVEVPDWLGWSRDRLFRFDWLRDLLDVPVDASPPLAMTPPLPSAVGSYGAEACAWIESELRIRLRWWQRLAITRQLEHDDHGRLVWRVVVESASRRSGKSVRVRGVALWRLMFGPALFGERQEIIHTGSDLAVCRKVQKDVWRWAGEHALIVTKGNGKEAVESADGDTWLVRAQSATYGWDTTLGLVDEGWDVLPDTVSEGLEPSLMERSSPQLHLTSTAHRRATSLMRRRIRDAMAGNDGLTLLMLWASPPGSDPGDPAAWRSASPHWSEDRHEVIAAKYEKALAGELDVEADDLDPMAGFVAQYLNQWQLGASVRLRGREEHLVAEEAWESARFDHAVEGPAAVTVAVAVEDWFGMGAAASAGCRLADGRMVVTGRLFGSRAEAFGWAGAALEDAPEARLLVGATLEGSPELATLTRPGPGGGPVPVVAMPVGQAEVRPAFSLLRERLTGGRLLHDDAEDLAQLPAVLVVPGAGGLQVSPRSPRADLARCVAWIVQALDQEPAAPVPFFAY